jgi:hypothetical protein
MLRYDLFDYFLLEDTKLGNRQNAKPQNLITHKKLANVKKCRREWKD